LATHQFVEARPAALRKLMEFAIVREKIFHTGETIKHGFVALRAKQRLRLMLAVDLNERGSDARQRLHRCQFAIDEDTRTAAFCDNAPNHQLALVCGPRGE